MLIDKILKFFYPAKCVFCQNLINDYSSFEVCDNCKSTLPYTNDNGCFEGTKYISYVISPLYYKNETIRQAILRYKFNNAINYHKTFASIVVYYLQNIDDIKNVDLVLPVPLSKKRMRERGYNQAELISARIAGHFSIETMSDVFIRHRETKRQSTMDKYERLKNISGAFSITDKNPINGKTILLFDDVFTTGATMNSCAKILIQSGAKQVIGSCLAIVESFADNCTV